VRPENCRVVRASTQDLQVQAQLVLLEPLGAETLATFALGGQELTARLGPDFSLPLGTNCPLFVDPSHLQFFDAQSGQSI
jgi:multiple sugar transport system ATP-binding protein